MYRLLCAIFFGCIYKVRTNRRTTGISTSAPCFIIRRPTPKFYKKKKIWSVFIKYRSNFTVHDGQIELFTVYLKAGVHKSGMPGRWWGTKSCMVAPNICGALRTELASCHPSGE